MDVSGYVSNSLTLDVLTQSQSKSLVLLNSGMAKSFPDGKTKICFLVEIDGKQMDYTPNKTTLKVMVKVWGTETTRWVGKRLNLAQGVVNGKDAIIGSPLAT